jgi:hypothetical protein
MRLKLPTVACVALAVLSTAWFVWAVIALEGILSTVQWAG